MNDNCNPDDVNRAADVMISAYGKTNMFAALHQARRLEGQLKPDRFARLVREEVERRCLGCGDDADG